VFTRTRLAEALKGKSWFRATAVGLFPFFIARLSQKSSDEDQSSHFSPEQICLDVGRFQPVRVWRGKLRFALVFGVWGRRFRRFEYGFFEAGEIDVYLCSERQGY
jgi:hypothetical protein